MTEKEERPIGRRKFFREAASVIGAMTLGPEFLPALQGADQRALARRSKTGLSRTPSTEKPGLLRTEAHTFGWQGEHFLLDGKPLQILSGEMHYPRVPRPYWRDRMRKMKGMGLNTLCTYIFWNLHEPQPGVAISSCPARSSGRGLSCISTMPGAV